ncbi:MAG TPA: hypothetical protein PLK31_19375, partial [Chloroflexota bacterium]|nr:hypothetical protein [Chloroflexota bacterium]
MFHLAHRLVGFFIGERLLPLFVVGDLSPFNGNELPTSNMSTNGRAQLNFKEGDRLVNNKVFSVILFLMLLVACGGQAEPDMAA